MDVAVTDSRGRPVRDLSAADFVLYEDNRVAPLAVFAPPSRDGDERRPSRPPGPAPVAPPAAPEREPVTFVLYVDNWNLTPEDRWRVLPGLTSFLKDQLARGGARVLVISAGEETHLLSPLTSDVETVVAALRSAQREPAHGHITRSDERQAIDTVKNMLESGLGSCADSAGIMLLQAPIRFQAQVRSQDLQSTLTRLEAVTRALGTLPGSKALFYVSGGLEQRPAIDLFNQLGDICPAALQRDFSTLLAPMQEYDLSRSLQALAARANAARVTLYPIDASGLGGSSLADPSQANRLFVPSPKTTRIRAENLRAGEWILAEETGGSAVFNANEPQKPLAQLAGQIRGAYALGFTPAHEPEGRIHSLRVELKRKGPRVRSTPSYFHAERPEPGVSRTLAALLVGLQEDTLGALVSIDPQPSDPEAKPGSGTANVRISVPLARLAAAEDAAERHGRLRVVIAVWRAGTGASEHPFDVREQLIDVPLPPSSSSSQGERREFVVTVPLGAGHHEIAVGVHDLYSWLVSYRRVSP